MAKDLVDALVSLLSAEQPEKQAAAALVIGELSLRGAKVVAALGRAVEKGEPAVQRQALLALSRVAPGKAAELALPLLRTRGAELRDGAIAAIVAAGDDVLPLVRERLAAATADEQRALDTVLSRLGGKQAFTVLLTRLLASAPEAAHHLAVGARPQLKDADTKQRRGYLAELTRFVKGKAAQASPGALAASLKLMGYLELPEAVPTLLAFASGKGDRQVREEAVAALRFMPAAAVSRAAQALVDIAEKGEPALARAALFTLGNLELTPRLAERLGRIAAGGDAERALVALEHLGRQATRPALQVLADLLVGGDRARAELAATALRGKVEAVPLLLQALGRARGEQLGLVERVLRGQGEAVPAAARAEAVKVLVARAAREDAAAEALLTTARALDAATMAVELRRAISRLEKGRDQARARAMLAALCRSDAAADADRLRLAVLELDRAHFDTHPTARSRDAALASLEQLERRGVDVAGALRAEKSLSTEARYYVGFHFAEQQSPIGEELLSQVITAAGRKKLGTMARNKLALVQRGDSGD